MNKLKAILFIALLLNCALFACSNQEDSSSIVSPEIIASNSTLTSVLKNGTISVGMDVSDIRFQPFEMKNEKGEIIGFDVDLAQMIADELGVTLKIVETNWDGIIPALINKKFDMIISGMAITTERNKAINFSSSYYLSGKSILMKKGYENIILSYKDLDRANIVIGATFNSDQMLDRYFPNAKIIRYESDEEVVAALMEGKVRAYIADKPHILIFLNKYPTSTSAILSPFTYEPIAIGICKGDLDLLNWINNFIEIIRGDGRLSQLENKWMLDYVQER